MLICFDVETSGLPDFKAAADAPGQPRIVELAAALFDSDTLQMVGDPLCDLVKPDGWTIDPGAEEVHKINLALCEEHGRPISEIMDEFDAMVSQATTIIGFSVKFDQKMARAERRRLGRPDRYAEHREYDVMWGARPYANVLGKNGSPKLPKLTEAYKALCGEELEDAHTALADIEATMRVARVLRDKWKVDLTGTFPPKNDDKPAASPAKAKPKARKDFAPFNPDSNEVF